MGDGVIELVSAKIVKIAVAGEKDAQHELLHQWVEPLCGRWVAS